MDHMSDADKEGRESKRDEESGDSAESLDQEAGSYYYDDATNYEMYRDDNDDDDDETVAADNGEADD